MYLLNNSYFKCKIQMLLKSKIAILNVLPLPWRSSIYQTLVTTIVYIILLNIKHIFSYTHSMLLCACGTWDVCVGEGVHEYTHTCMCTPACMWMWMPKVNTLFRLPLFSPFYFGDKVCHWIWSTTLWLYWRVSQSQDPPVFAFLLLRL